MKTLQECNWNIFAFTELFEIRDGYYNKKPPFEPNGKIPFLGATQNDNGITGFYTLPTIQKYDKVGTTIMNDKEKRIFKGNCIAITNNGSVGNAYYQIVDFTCSHDITPIYLKTHTLSRYIAMFLIPMIMKSGESFEYAKKWRPKRMRNSQLLLPVTPDNTPDWQFMEDYMREVESKLLAQARPALQEKVNKYANLQLPTLNSRNWKIFAFTELFDIRDGYYNKKPPFESNGKIPFLGATQYDNGITGFYTLPTIHKYDKVGNIEDKDNENRIYKGNCIAVTNDGSVGKAYYQRIPFTCSHSITPLYLRNHVLNRNIAQFLIPLIMKSGESFEYGRKWRPKRMRNSQLLLPVTPDNTPDWQFMEDYMRAVEAKQIAAYLQQKH